MLPEPASVPSKLQELMLPMAKKVNSFALQFSSLPFHCYDNRVFMFGSSTTESTAFAPKIKRIDFDVAGELVPNRKQGAGS
jgi:hypothetical protein